MTEPQMKKPKIVPCGLDKCIRKIVVKRRKAFERNTRKNPWKGLVHVEKRDTNE
jgi:hypothetical protein